MNMTKAPKNPTLAAATIDAAQLDLFYDAAEHAVAIAFVSAISDDESRTEDALQLARYGANWPANAQLDLFINTPFDQALSALRRALLNNQLEQAAKLYQTATEFDAVRRREDSGPSTANALSDAHVCLQLLQTQAGCRDPRSVWARLNAQDAVLQRFFGAESKQIVHTLLRCLAACPELEVFDPRQAKAYAAQIWFDLDEPELASAVLDRDPASVVCPHRLHLWAQVAAILAKTQVSHRQNPLSYWQALCFDWPEQAEEYLGQSPYFTKAWAAFCDLDELQDISAFPGFASLHNFFSWPLPDIEDSRPCAELIRAARALNLDRDSVPLRLKLKSLNPSLFHQWIHRRSATR